MRRQRKFVGGRASIWNVSLITNYDIGKEDLILFLLAGNFRGVVRAAVISIYSKVDGLSPIACFGCEVADESIAFVDYWWLSVSASMPKS